MIEFKVAPRGIEPLFPA